MRIRKARREDFEEYLRLRKDTFRYYRLKGETRKIKKEFNDFVKSPKKLFLVVEEGNSLIGYLVATFLTNVWRK